MGPSDWQVGVAASGLHRTMCADAVQGRIPPCGRSSTSSGNRRVRQSNVERHATHPAMIKADPVEIELGSAHTVTARMSISLAYGLIVPTEIS